MKASGAAAAPARQKPLPAHYYLRKAWRPLGMRPVKTASRPIRMRAVVGGQRSKRRRFRSRKQSWTKLRADRQRGLPVQDPGRVSVMNDKVEGPNTRFSITDQEALQFHSRGRPGKLEIMPTKPMATQRDLSLAYSPGVA